jgi:prepilin-type N-terminal cleavage/methylation domain-containing protein
MKTVVFRRKFPRRAFTLIEIMMVVAIIGLVAAMGIPAMLTEMHRGPMGKAVNDVMDICSHARALAILNNVTTTVVFHPQTGEIAISAVQDSNQQTSNSADDPFPSDAPQENPPPAAGPKPVNSAQFDDGIAIEMLDINLLEYKDSDEARVRFFPNGTSDEMTLILHSGDDYKKITLEVTTALASVGAVK